MKKMSDLMCENCGSKHFEEVNGIVTCVSCGTKYPNIKLSTIGIDEELKEKEIRRLVKVNSRVFSLLSEREPKLGLLTDEEILKYAPNSYAATKIRSKNSDKKKMDRNTLIAIIIIFGFLFLISLFGLLSIRY